MDRWDFDCQECGRNIGDAWYVDPVWYACSQNENEYALLRAVYPRSRYEKRNGTFSLEDKTIPENVREKIMERLKYYHKEKDEKLGEATMIGSGIVTIIDFRKSEVMWYLSSEEDKYYEKAGIMKHEIKGRGRGRLGYTFDEECAEKLGYKCNLCGSKLVKVTADEHPGGKWGIRGQDGMPIREPAPAQYADVRISFS